MSTAVAQHGVVTKSVRVTMATPCCFLSSSSPVLLTPSTFHDRIIKPAVVPLTKLKQYQGKRNFEAASVSNVISAIKSSTKDLLIIGAGDLGLLIGAEWRKQEPTARIIAETKSTKSHSRLESAGFETYTSEEISKDAVQSSNVIFCVPPPKIPDYFHILQDCVNTRVPPSSEFEKPLRKFLFISSTAVHPPDVDVITELTEYTNTERAQLLAQCEQYVLSTSYGLVLRFSGLYSLRRGAHAFWISKQMKRISERRTANMLHRLDAAKAAVATLRNGNVGNTYLAAANSSVTAKEICDALKLHPEYENSQLPQFFANDSEKRACDCSWTRQEIGWEPQWESFTQFMREDGERMRNGHPLERLIE